MLRPWALDHTKGPGDRGGRFTGTSQERAAPLRCSVPVRISGDVRPVRIIIAARPVRIRGSSGHNFVRVVIGPLGERPGVESGGESGDFQGRNFVGRRDAGSAVDGGGNIGADAETRIKRSRSASGERNLPSAPTFAVVGALTAPGIWPARGSTGSNSPRYRSPARASSNNPCRPHEAACPASITGMAPPSPSGHTMSPGSTCRSPLSTSKPASRQAARPPSSR